MTTRPRIKPELLSPAGDHEKLRYALAFGADAVYAGAPQYSLRARENDFNIRSVTEGAEYTHRLGKKFFLTINLVAPNRKVRTFMNHIDTLLSCKPDALIMADPGLIDIVHERHPEVPIHLSVQANAMNWASVKFWKKLGVTRVIASRELSIDDVKEIKDRVPEMELEVFVHGAICIAHSGRCLLSNYFNNRDANQGVCTNACRWPYKVMVEEQGRPGELMEVEEDEHGTYVFNAKDLMAIEYLPQLIDAGIDSLKIEGRSKSAYYASIATRAYRQAIDAVMAGQSVPEHCIRDLYKIHNRGYTAGFLVGPSSPDFQNYEASHSNDHTHDYGGVVVKQEGRQILVSPRSKITKGSELAVVTPTHELTLIANELKLEDGSFAEAVHGGTDKNFWLELPENIDCEFAMVAKKIPAEDKAPVSLAV